MHILLGLLPAMAILAWLLSRLIGRILLLGMVVAGGLWLGATAYLQPPQPSSKSITELMLERQPNGEPWSKVAEERVAPPCGPDPQVHAGEKIAQRFNDADAAAHGTTPRLVCRTIRED